MEIQDNQGPLIPPIFKDSECVYIVGGGPSLKGFDFERLRNKEVVAINKSYEVCPFAKLLWWTDDRFGRIHYEALTSHPAPWKAAGRTKVVRFEYPKNAQFHFYRFTGLQGFEDKPWGLRHGNNGGYASLHLAVKLGAKNVILLGYDMKHEANGQTHWHGGHVDERGTKIPHREKSMITNMVPYFGSLKEELDKRGVQVVNACPDSNITIWPKISLDEIT